MMKRDELHAIVDKLSDEDLEKLSLYIEAMATGDPVQLALATAPWDDEPESEEERVGAEEALRELREGKWVSQEVIEADIG